MADANILIKTLTDQIKQYGDIQSQRAKIQSDLLINSMKAKQNFFFKQQERVAKAEEENQAQQAIQSRIQGIQAQQEPVTPYGDPGGGRSNYPGGQVESAGVGQVKPIRPFRDTPTPRIGTSKKGIPEINQPLNRKDFIYQRIQEKKSMQEELESRGDPRAANFELSKAERAFEKKYLTGTSKEREEEDEVLFPEDETGAFQGEETRQEEYSSGAEMTERTAAYKKTVETYGKEEAQKIIRVIQDLQKEGKSFGEIRRLMEQKNINPELFLKFYR